MKYHHPVPEHQQERVDALQEEGLFSGRHNAHYAAAIREAERAIKEAWLRTAGDDMDSPVTPLTVETRLRLACLFADIAVRAVALGCGLVPGVTPSVALTYASRTCSVGVETWAEDAGVPVLPTQTT